MWVEFIYKSGKRKLIDVDTALDSIIVQDPVPPDKWNMIRRNPFELMKRSEPTKRWFRKRKRADGRIEYHES